MGNNQPTAGVDPKKLAKTMSKKHTNNNGTKDYESMSTKELRKLLTRSGEDCSSYLEKGELVAAAKRLDETDYDDEAKKIFAQLNLQPSTANHYSNLDPIYKHNSEGGGTVYVGNYMAAANLKTLDERNITAVVNCQDVNTENFFEGVPKMTYLRFPVARLSHSRMGGVVMGPKHAALNGMMPAFDFIDQQISAGNSVLIHCLAGAHRAGTVGVGYLMYKTGMGVDEAIATAKACRPIINPFATLLSLLRYLEKDLKEKRKEDEVKV